MDKYNFNKCNICKIRGYIECNLCENQIFFCSRGHLHTHQLKFHKNNMSNINNTDDPCKNNSNYDMKSNRKLGKICVENSDDNDNKNMSSSTDPRKVFEQLQNAKLDIENKIKDNRFSEAMININKLLNVSSKFYQDDHLFVKTNYYILLAFAF